MDKFPAWAQWPKGDGRQVSHGLNLALPLRNRLQLPQMLWDIVVARPKIERAMQELSFIHYARFVPSWDASALMVTTAFDGPLEPYVMDFVIALGDVFDVLLGYVEDAPPLPVREYPDEFWAFVQHWNRVPFLPRVPGGATLFPKDFDYPLYSAYPEKTVIDIVGPRRKLPQPAIDHPAAPVDLDDVQGNILRGYRATGATHLFLTIIEAAKARRWLSDVFPAPDKAGAAAPVRVTSAAPWRRDKKDGPAPPQVMANVGFTYAGMQVLLPGRKADLARFSDAFKEGPARRSERNGDVGPSDPSKWRFGKPGQAIHVVVSLYTKDAKATTARLDTIDSYATALHALRNDAAGNGMKVLHEEEAAILPDSGVYFGYRDGIAHPRISGQCHPDEPDMQPSASPGEFLLGENYASIFGGPSLGDLAPDIANNGTFGTLRLLEQHVDVFEKTLESEATRLSVSKDLLKAKLLGRWADGGPLSLYPTKPGKPEVRNDFDFAPSWEYPGVPEDHGGMRCPVGAHIRRVNPRTARVAGQRHSRRLIRRGMPIQWKEGGTEKKGLLGLFIGASIERQFEFIQRQWIQSGDSASGIRGTQDPIASIRANDTEFPIPGVGTATVPPLVTTRGCLYLFFPSISMLRGLQGAAEALPISLASVRAAINLQQPEELKALDLAELQEQLASLRDMPEASRTELKALLDEAPDPDIAAQFSALKPGFAPTSPEPPGNIRPLDPGFIANPFLAYAELRGQGRKVVWVPEHRAYWVLDRAEAQRLFDDSASFRQNPSSATLRGIITMDPPRHTEVRKLVAEAFREASKNVDQYIADAIGGALKELKGLEQFDFVQAYGARVPRDVYWRIFGLQEDDQPACDALAQTVMLHYGQPERPGMSDSIVFTDASVRLSLRLGVMLAKAMISLNGTYKGTLIGEIARRTIPWGDLTIKESVVTLVQMVLAGYMSSQFLLGTAMRNLLAPDPRIGDKGGTPWQKLAELHQKNDSDFKRLLELSLEEARRVDPPVTIVERFAGSEGIQIGGVTLPKDCPVHAVVASANRDGVAADRLEEFHYDRRPGAAHLSLGHGIHECIGKWLQEKMVPAALVRLIEQMPELRLRDPDAVPAWFDNVYFRALQSLPVKRCS